jgi:hypothetical protein
MVHGAALLNLVCNESILPVQEQDTKLLYLFMGHCHLQVGQQRLPVADDRAILYRAPRQVRGNFSYEPKQGQVVMRQAERQQLARLCCQDMTQAGEVLQQ